MDMALLMSLPVSDITTDTTSLSPTAAPSAPAGHPCSRKLKGNEGSAFPCWLHNLTQSHLFRALKIEYGAGSEIKGLPAPSEPHHSPSLCMPGVHEGLLIIAAFRKQSRGSLE